MEWELGGFFGAQGLDTRICWGFRRKKMRGSLHCGFASGRDDGFILFPVGMTVVWGGSPPVGMTA